MTTTDTSTLRIRQDRHLIRSTSHSKRFVVAHIEAPGARTDRRRPPVNLAIVLDRSGSMSGQKLDIAKRAVEMAIDRLASDDRFSVVVYDDTVDVVIASTMATTAARREAVDRLRTIDARGSTNLGEGWLRGCEQVAAHLATDGVNRCLLLTDGLANIGMTDTTELAGHATALRERGVSTSTFGVGNDFDERLLQEMADAGGGHFYYIADAPQIADAITSEVGETLQIVAREVFLEVSTREEIKIEAITPNKVTVSGNRTMVALGDLGAEQAVDVVLRLTFPYGEPGQEAGAIIGLVDRDGVFEDRGTAARSSRVEWTYATHAANDAESRDVEVDRQVARIFAARARQAAVALNRAGRYDEARQLLRATRHRIRDYAGRDAELNQILESLREDEGVFAAAMAEPERKVRHYASANLARCRDEQGRSMTRS